MEQFSLKGKNGIITGAASGIGRETALHLSRMGANLILVDLDTDGLESLADQIGANNGSQPLRIKVDISDETDIVHMVQISLKKFGTIDFLVNCAGILRRTPFLEISTQEWDLVLNINLRGQFFICREVLGHMKSAGQGVIVNVASLAGRTCSLLGGAHYTVAKHALVGLSRHLAREFAPNGIRVNAFCPGATLTPMTENTSSQEEIDRITANIPRGQWSDPREQANVIGFLVSESSANIVGACIDSNGGTLMI